MHFHRNGYPVSKVANDTSYLTITIVWNFESYSHLSDLFFHFSLLTCRFQRLLNDIIQFIFLVVPPFAISRAIFIPTISNHFFFAILIKAIFFIYVLLKLLLLWLVHLHFFLFLLFFWLYIYNFWLLCCTSCSFLPPSFTLKSRLSELIHF